MNIKYIDIHSHLGFEDYGNDIDQVVLRMQQNEVGTITVGADLKSSIEAVKVAEKYENIWACIGQHPNEKKDEIFDDSEYEKLVTHPKVVAIGECGLDYYNRISNIEYGISEEEKGRQKKLFIQQIEFAIKHDKPLMLHIRDAHDDAYEILKEYKGKIRANLHFYTSTIENAIKFIDLGFTISFPGIITFVKDLEKIVKEIPIDKIHVETDAPYASPVPHRGKRNESTYVIEVVKKIAEIRGEDFEFVRLRLLQNSINFFGLNL